MPYTRLTSDCISSCRLTRVPASSNALVVMARRPCPNSPISRSRRSRRSSSMKMTSHQHEAGRSQRSDDRTEPREARDTRVCFRGDDDGPRRACRLGASDCSEVGLDVFDRLLQLLDRTALAGAAHVRDLRADVVAVRGQVLGQMVHLPRHAPAGEAEHREHQRDHDEHGRDAADPALERGHRRRQDECQKDGEREGHEDGLRPVQDDDHQHTARRTSPTVSTSSTCHPSGPTVWSSHIGNNRLARCRATTTVLF